MNQPENLECSRETCRSTRKNDRILGTPHNGTDPAEFRYARDSRPVFERSDVRAAGGCRGRYEFDPADGPAGAAPAGGPYSGKPIAAGRDLPCLT